MKTCKVETVTDRGDWEALFTRVEDPHLPQSWAYGDAIHASTDWQLRHRALDAGGWRPRRLVFERNGAPVAICQLLEKPLAGFRWAALVDRGPLFLDPEPSEEVVRDVLSTLRRARKYFGLVLILVPSLLDEPQNERLLREVGFVPRQIEGYSSFRVNLRLSEDDMFGKLTSRWRRQLRQGMRTGASITFSSSPEDAEWMIDRHVQNMKEKGFDTPEAPVVRALYAASPDDFLVARAVLDGESLAGIATVKFGLGSDYFIGWVSELGRKTNVNSFLFWEAALELRRRGCHMLDLGGMRAGATEPFKRGMGGDSYKTIHNWLAF